MLLSRTLVRPSSSLRGALAAFHSSPSRGVGDDGHEDMKNVGSFLQTADSGSTYHVPNPNSPYRYFFPHQIMQPYRLTYDSIRKRPSLPRTRPRVGPSKREAQAVDPFYPLGVDPLKYAMNPAMFMPFVSEMGKIYGRNTTGLTKKNQRRVGKAVRRAKMMGILPVLSKRNIFHPLPSRLL